MLESLKWILWGFVAFVVIFCVYKLIIIPLIHRILKLRSKRMRAVATSLGLQFRERGDLDGRIHAAFKQLRFPFYDPRHGDWRVSNVIHGEIQGYGLLVFDHQYVTTFPGGDGQARWDWTAPNTFICISSKKLSLPAFERELEDRFMLNGRGTHFLYHRGGRVKSFSLDSCSGLIQSKDMAEHIRKAVALLQRGKRKLIRR